jgi:putative hydrolase of the HAD superfamily
MWKTLSTRVGTTLIAAVLFDLGGTLFSYEHRSAMHRPAELALERMGLSIDDPRVVAARRTASEQVERDYAVRPYFLHRDLFRDRVARAAVLLGVTPSPEVLQRFDVENHEAIVENLIPREDARRTLEGLRERKVYVSVVSNADDDYLDALLVRHAFDGLLDDWTSSEGAKSCKPNRLIYDHALRLAGSRAAETLFVGDSLAHDIAGAHAVGMVTALIGEPGAIAPLSHGLDSPVAADFTIGDLDQVLDIVDGSNEGR